MNHSSIFAQTIFIIIVAFIAAAAVVYSLFRRRNLFRSRLQERFGQAPEKMDPDLLKRLSDGWHKKQSVVNTVHIIDDTTWNDLDMDKVFERVNCCQTSVGEEYLYSLLHTPSFDEETLKSRESLFEILGGNHEKRLELQVLLGKMGRSNSTSLYSFGLDVSSKRLKSPGIYTALALLPLLCVGLLFINLAAGLFAVIFSFVTNIVVYTLTKLYIERELGALRYFSSLLWCAKKICRLNISPGLTEEITAGLRPFKKISGKVSSLARQKVTDADMIMDYFKIPFLSDIRNYNKAISIISRNTEAYLNLCDLVGSLDASVCVLSFRKSLPRFSRPQFTEKSVIEARGVYHPLLSEPVLNDADIARGSLVSGSNASGKSTFIKALAVNGIFAQTINTCTADSYHTRFALVITSMAVRDDITAGESYFITEIKSLRRIIETARGVFCACYIDEILKGTNTVERIAASCSVLRFIGTLSCLCVAATHDIELTRMLEGLYDNYHFEELMTEGGMAFDYKIKSGPSRTRNAIKLLSFMEFDPRIIEDAQRLVDKFESTGVWDSPA